MRRTFNKIACWPETAPADSRRHSWTISLATFMYISFSLHGKKRKKEESGKKIITVRWIYAAHAGPVSLLPGMSCLDGTGSLSHSAEHTVTHVHTGIQIYIHTVPAYWIYSTYRHTADARMGAY